MGSSMPILEVIVYAYETIHIIFTSIATANGNSFRTSKTPINLFVAEAVKNSLSRYIPPRSLYLLYCRTIKTETGLLCPSIIVRADISAFMPPSCSFFWCFLFLHEREHAHWKRSAKWRSGFCRSVFCYSVQCRFASPPLFPFFFFLLRNIRLYMFASGERAVSF
ncbi:hypothetical protein CEXT_561741 [Caerostris extrusa]|uniref:Uncharacterized protein n=1 Tax=Caerostris extrusa TaxID=172846 RepID=A0AAV4S0L2_CAEEX|nr:hypothetical protein CEXT_561741 [Caerostris extrusa]